ncbi:hypothetical protein PUN28_019758 [Cardiocondyla obscurior]
MSHSEKKILNEREIIFNIDTNDEEFLYLTGHVINGKNLFPAMGYIFYIWEMFASLNKKEYTEMPIIFEDINFIRATVLTQQNKIELTFSIQKGSNRFEIIEGHTTIVTGRIRIPTSDENTRISANSTKYAVDGEMNNKDIYKELRLRGYQYSGIFRGLNRVSVTKSNGSIAWAFNWIAFMDSMLQMMILGQNTRDLLVPTRICKLTIDPKYHLHLIQNTSINNRQLPVNYYKHLNAITSGGIEIYGVVATFIPNRLKTVNIVLEEHTFVAHRDLESSISLQNAIRMSIHLALECCNMLNVKIIEFLDTDDKLTSEDLNSPLINKILSDLPQIRHETKLVTNHKNLQNISLPDNISVTEMTKLSKNENCLMVFCFNILKKNKEELYKQLLSLLMPQGFLLTLEESTDCEYSYLKKNKLNIIIERQINNKKLLLLRKTQNVEKNQYHVVHVNNYDFTWVDTLKSIINMQNKSDSDKNIILVAEKNFESGLLGLVNCLRKEPGGETIRSVFIQDSKAPAFSLHEPLYMKQLLLNLPINVIRSGNVWGSYRHFPLSALEPKFVQNAYIKQKVQ